MRTPLSMLLKEKSSQIQTLRAQDSCFHCAEILAKYGIGALLVMEGEKLQGIISERDLIKKLVSQQLDPMKIKVSEIMTSSLITVTPETTVQEAMEIMTNKRIRHLPVLSSEKLVGIISIGDITRWVMLQQQQEISALTGYIHGG